MSSKFSDETGILKDYYKILDIPTTATDEDIRKAHHAGVLKHHPDKQTTDGERRQNTPLFRLIQEAYEVLKTPKMRREYDLAYVANRNGTDPRRTPPPSPYTPAESGRSEFRRPDFPRRTPRPENESARPIPKPRKPSSDLKTPQDLQAAYDLMIGRQRFFVAQKDTTEVAGIEARTYFEQQFNRIHQDAQRAPDGHMYSSVTRKDAMKLWSGMAGKLHALEAEMIKLSWILDKIGIFWDRFMKTTNWKEMKEFSTATQQIKEGKEMLDSLDRESWVYRKSAWEDVRKFCFVEM
ncbi:hypothetical protein EG328_002558 [Venturia inaequalis]|uniref:J domain-containing protein n=1 Tax=Venturia inaequalis TaxID=5025 RepID=A0A8H3UGU2_VENIN|nr:hypothetical protein EG327_010792 [Venturia inaequalis]KAE9976597.1 hypothetical protein EG328_002558 [Venturia inaequalis]RDI85449.1 hypothetical protein Vi05172_g4832 [Venturia inaequalis]